MRKKSGLITAPLVAKVPSPILHEYICLSSHIHLRNEWDVIFEHLKKLNIGLPIPGVLDPQGTDSAPSVFDQNNTRSRRWGNWVREHGQS